MRMPRTVHRVWLTLCCLLVAAGLLAQTQTQQPASSSPPFVPQVGQAGKDVVWVPTPQSLVDKMLDMAGLTPSDFLMDLGSGDGRTVITAAKRGARALGIEYNPNMIELSTYNAAQAGVQSKASFRKADLFETDLSQATVITMFLLPDINLKLRPKILDLKPGTRVVSDTFTMGDWEPDQTQTVTADCTSWCTALLWYVPAKVAGTWTLPQGQLTLQQNYQLVSGSVNGAAIANGRLMGADISFTAGGVQYTGRVSGNSMKGTTTSNGKTGNWTATKAAS
jgi:hypothetical protein